MRDSIARILTWLGLSLAPRRPGRHSAEYLAELPDAVPASPWSKPWTSPNAEAARKVFRDQAETTMELGIVQRERRKALEFAVTGRDYPYTFPGAPFPRSAFATAGATA